MGPVGLRAPVYQNRSDSLRKVGINYIVLTKFEVPQETFSETFVLGSLHKLLNHTNGKRTLLMEVFQDGLAEIIILVFNFSVYLSEIFYSEQIFDVLLIWQLFTP